MAPTPNKFCKIVVQEQADSLRLPNKFASRFGDKLPKKEVYLKVPLGLSWPIEVKYSKSDNEVLFQRGWSAFRDYYSIGCGYLLEFKYNGVAKFDVIIFDTSGLEIKYKYEHKIPNVPPPQRFCKIIVDPECDRLRVPQTFTQRFGDLPNYVFVNVPGGTSLWGVVVRAEDGEIYMGNRWKEFAEYYDICPGHSLVFEFQRIYGLFDVTIYDGTETEKEFRFNLDDVHVEGCDSDEDDSSCFVEKVHEKPKRKGKGVVEDYQQEDNWKSVGIALNCSSTGESDESGDNSVDCSVRKSARTVKLGSGHDSDEDDSVVFVEEIHGKWKGKGEVGTSVETDVHGFMSGESDESGDDSVDYLVRKSAQTVKLGSRKKAKRKKTSDGPGEMKISPLTVDRPRLSFSKEIKHYNKYRLYIPNDFVSSTGIGKFRDVRIMNDGGKWTVQLVKYGHNQFSMSTGWYDFLTDNRVVVGSTISFVLTSKNIIETHVIKEGADKQALFGIAKKKQNFLEFPKPNKTNVSGMEYHLDVEYDVDEVCESDDDDSCVFVEEIIRNKKGKEKVVTENYQDNNRISLGLDEHGSTRRETKRKRSEGHDSVEDSLRKSARLMKLGGGTISEKIKTVDCESGMRNSSGIVKHTSASFTKEITLNSVHKLIIPKQFVSDTGIDKISSLRIKDDEGRKWPVHVIKSARNMIAISSGWCNFLIGNNVVIGSTISFALSSKNTIEAHVVREGADSRALFKFAKRGRNGKYELCKPKKSHVEGEFVKKLKPCNSYKLDLPAEFTRINKITPGMDIMLQNVLGRKWKVHILAKDENTEHCNLGGGWHRYLVDNNVVVGSRMAFKPVSTSDRTIEIETRVVKVGPKPEQLFLHVRRKGNSYAVQ